MELPIRCHILFCRRKGEPTGTPEQVFLLRENAEEKQAEYQAQYSDETVFYIKDFIIEDWLH